MLRFLVETIKIVIQVECIKLLFERGDSIKIGEKWINFINVDYNTGKRTEILEKLGDLRGYGSNYTLGSRIEREDSTIKGEPEVKNSEPVVEKIKKTLNDLNCIACEVEFPSTSRLEYNRDSILETWKLARETDKEVFRNDHSEFECVPLVRFLGDDESETMAVSKANLPKGKEMIRVTSNFCWSLDSYLEGLFESLSQFNNEFPSLGGDWSLHIQRIFDISIGQFIKKDKIKVTEHNSNKKNDENGVEGFERRLLEFVLYKRILILRDLIVADSVLSIDSNLMKAVNNPYIKYDSINENEKELFLLTFGLASEYYLRMVCSSLKFLKDGRKYEGSPNEVVKTLMLHRLFNKGASNIPGEFDSHSMEEIQETMLIQKVTQRKIVLRELMELFKDPREILKNKIESIAQSRSMHEDRSGDLFYQTKVDLKSNMEDKLEEMEKEISKFEMKHKIYGENPFNITKDEFNYILEGQNKSNNKESLKLEDKEFGEEKVGKSELWKTFINDYILDINEGQKGEIDSKKSVLESLNSIINPKSMSRFFCNIVSHAIRPGWERETKVEELYYITNSAKGIKCKIEGILESKKYNKAYLVPLIDLVNHSISKENGEIVLRGSEEGLEFVLSSKKEIGVGEEIFVNYGENTNNVMFMDYGFVSNDELNNQVVMEVDSKMVRDAAKIHDLSDMMPSLFPEGLPKEKLEELRKINLMEINDQGDLGDLYKDPHFEGIPFAKFMEFNERFMASRENSDPSSPYYYTNSSQDRTQYVERYPNLEEENSYTESKVNPLILINEKGIPDPRLIVFLKVVLCKTKKKLDWIKGQSYELLSESVNSPIDFKAFAMASSVALINLSEKYQDSLYEDIRKMSNNKVNKVQNEYKNLTFKSLAEKVPNITNSMVLAHAMRQKIPIYKCASFYSRISKGVGNNKEKVRLDSLAGDK